MNIQKNADVDKINLTVLLEDCVGNLDFLLEKVGLLTEDIYINYSKRMDLSSECGRVEAENIFRIAHIRSDILCNYMLEIRKMMPELQKIAHTLYETMKEEKMFK